MKKLFCFISMLFFIGLLAGCGVEGTPTSDQVAHQQQEKLSAQANSEVGMAAIHNFTEKRLMKLILEKRDTANLATYTYTFDQMTGKFRFMGNTIGYGLPYATQYTNPQTIVQNYRESMTTLPQADPNGLFSPASADGTWILMKDPNSNDVEPVYIEPHITVSVFKLPDSIVETK